MAQLFWEDRTTDLDQVRMYRALSSPLNAFFHQVPSILEYVYQGLEHDISDSPSFEVHYV